MTAKEYLEQYEDALRNAERMKKEYDRESALLDAIRSPQGSDGQPHGSGVSSPIEQKAVRLAEKLTEYRDAAMEAMEMKRQIIHVIRKVKGAPGDVLYERYVNLRKWSEVAEVLKYSERQIYNLRDRGLDEVDKILGKRFQ